MHVGVLPSTRVQVTALLERMDAKIAGEVMRQMEIQAGLKAGLVPGLVPGGTEFGPGRYRRQTL